MLNNRGAKSKCNVVREVYSLCEILICDTTGPVPGSTSGIAEDVSTAVAHIFGASRVVVQTTARGVKPACLHLFME